MHRFYYSLSFFSFYSFFLAFISAMICFNGLTVSGSSRLNRLKQMLSINCGSGALQDSCLWLSILPNLSGFSPNSRVM